ncbi:unnamed protein product [Paramecium sonneborni]|uniref:Uncharacterized protein n=1 Tax=Paramecium sonneborni TaxID=65129 RepID=A0A8S1R3K5_9CILI|nr:unnamed protein product [Paramecium sonneborni]
MFTYRKKIFQIQIELMLKINQEIGDMNKSFLQMRGITKKHILQIKNQNGPSQHHKMCKHFIIINSNLLEAEERIKISLIQLL